METIKINIEGRIYEVDKSLTVLEAARSVGYNIPTLCYWKGGHNSLASCRVCLVEIATYRPRWQTLRFLRLPSRRCPSRERLRHQNLIPNGS